VIRRWFCLNLRVGDHSCTREARERLLRIQIEQVAKPNLTPFLTSAIASSFETASAGEGSESPVDYALKANQ
jgi:hypothetical protein